VGIAAGFRRASLSKVQAAGDNIKIRRKKVERIPALFNSSDGIVISWHFFIFISMICK